MHQIDLIRPETHKGLKRVARAQYSIVNIHFYQEPITSVISIFNKMATARSPCGGFKARVLHFKVKNTP